MDSACSEPWRGTIKCNKNGKLAKAYEEIRRPKLNIFGLRVAKHIFTDM